MTSFRHLPGLVYILFNESVGRVKVGMTTNNVEGRLVDVNRMWLGKNATCQVCGGRRLTNKNGVMPNHVVSGVPCHGGEFLPLEKDSELAYSYLEMLKEKNSSLSGSEKSSSTKRINTLVERIKRYESLGKPVGRWKIDTVYYTNSAEEVELGAHELLSEFLDKTMPFGEVFSCSIEKARQAVEKMLEKLGYKDSAERKIYKNQD